jgi:type I restriction enzyme R subunit
LIKFKSKHSAKDKESIEKDIFNLLNTEVSLRSKRELIEKFIQESLPILKIRIPFQKNLKNSGI